MDLDKNVLILYHVLKTHGFEQFFSDFIDVLQFKDNYDFQKITRKQLQQIGIVSQREIKKFEELQKLLKDNYINKEIQSQNDIDEVLICQHVRNKEAVIITEADVVLEDSIGSGHFGKVYKGIWKRKFNKREVHVDVALKSLSDGGEMSWRKEVSIFTSLNHNHSNIIKFYGLLIGGDENVRMVTEYAKYGSLLDRLRERRITSISLLSQFALQICNGMIYLHSNNLVHRDLSARNILVTALNQVKISDFGLSKILNENESEWIMETKETLPMRWLSPESYNYGVFTAASDVWSYGVVLWEIFTFGDVPWGDFNNNQTKDKIKEGRMLPEPQFCPFGFYHMMQTCFRYDAAERPKFQFIFNELLMIQPDLVQIVIPSSSPYDLSVSNNDVVTAIKPLNFANGDIWLGQNERTLIFGQFDRNNSIEVDISIPYDNISSSQEKLFQIRSTDFVDEDKENEPVKPQYELSEEYKIARENFLRKSKKASEPYIPSKLNFKETDEFAQETVNDRISRNWNAFLTHCDTLKPPATTEDIKTDLYLQPEKLTRKTSSIQSLINSIDPFAKNKSLSQENIHCLDASIQSITNSRSTGDLNHSSTKRERPKPGNMNFYNKVSSNTLRLDENDDSYIKDSMTQNDISLTNTSNHEKVNLSELHTSAIDVKNEQYLLKYSHVIPVSTDDQEIQKMYRLRLSSLQKSSTIDSAECSSSTKTPKHFTYDPDAPLCDLPRSKKERTKFSVSNYTNNSWDLFDDCVKDKKKVNKTRKKNSPSEISWPLNASNSSHINKDTNLSAKFQEIRKSVPNATVTESLNALRYSNNNVKKAIYYLHVDKLLQLKLGFSSEKCAEVLAKHDGSFADAEKNLLLDFFSGKFKELHRNQVIQVLEENRWNREESLKHLFIATCKQIGVDKQRANALLIENKHDPIKSLEVAKILRLAEITSQSEHSCFRILAYCEWDLERAVDYALNV